MKSIKKACKFIKKFDIFTLLVIFLILAFLAVGVKFLTRKDQWVTVELWGSGGEWWWNTGAPPYWVANAINAGDVEKDAGGKKIAEILEIKKYEDYERKKFSVKAKLKVSRNPKTGKIKYKSLDLAVGSPLTINLDSKTISGNITFIEGMKDEREKKDLMVTLKLYDTYSWRAEAIKVGDKSSNENGEVYAEVLEKKVDFAEMTVVTDRGEVFARQNPLKRDITLKLQIKAVKNSNQYFFSNTFEIKIGNRLFVVMPNYNFEGTITEFSVK